VILLDFENLDWHAYSPGLLEQDLFTIPFEAGLIAAMNEFYTPSPMPLLPFRDEVQPLQRNSSRHPKELLVPIGAAWAVGTFGFLETATERFPIAPLFRGWIHAHLVTEMITSFAKVTFQRPRPFYELEKRKGRLRKDDRFSFFSGHASHAFAFAGYSSSMVLAHTDNSAGAVFYTAGALTLASMVARARAIDGQHNWSDVVAGSLVGLTTGVLIQTRVDQVVDDYGLRPDPCAGDECTRRGFRASLSPLLMRMEGKDVLGLNLNMSF
jgi:membrane-associated phospholipid phosphatase